MRLTRNKRNGAARNRPKKRKASQDEANFIPDVLTVIYAIIGAGLAVATVAAYLRFL